MLFTAFHRRTLRKNGNAWKLLTEKIKTNKPTLDGRTAKVLKKDLSTERNCKTWNNTFMTKAKFKCWKDSKR